MRLLGSRMRLVGAERPARRDEPDGTRWLAALTSALMAAVAALGVTALREAPTRLVRGLSDPATWLDAVGVDSVVATLAAAGLWLLAVRVSVGFAAAVAGRLPGAAGAFARRIASIALPRALYRAAAGAAGLGVLLSPSVAWAAAPHPGGTTAASAAVPSPLPPTSSLPAPQLPESHTPDVPSSDPRTAAAPERAPDPRTVTVRPGYTLWRIAADHLDRAPSPARVAAAWPRWFAANRAVIGTDPDLLRPGEVLHAPHSQEVQR
jgi:hypothetical protein